MRISFTGKVAIVTGAGTGLGRSHALQLAARGACVVVNDLGGSVDGSGGSGSAANAVVAEIEAAGGEAISSGANVTNEQQVAQMVAEAMTKWGRIDILINNAGILRDKSFAKMQASDWRDVIDVHLHGSAYCSLAVWPIMRQQGYGRIVMTTSTSGIYGNFGQANYGAAKTAVVGLMNTLHIEGGKYNIRVNCISPTAATRMTEGLIPEAVMARLAPENVTPAVLFLASEEAPSRTILLAGGGCYTVAKLMEAEGVYLPEHERSAEAIAQHFPQMLDFTGAHEILEGGEHVNRLVKKAIAAES